MHTYGGKPEATRLRFLLWYLLGAIIMIVALGTVRLLTPPSAPHALAVEYLTNLVFTAGFPLVGGVLVLVTWRP